MKNRISSQTPSDLLRSLPGAIKTVDFLQAPNASPTSRKTRRTKNWKDNWKETDRAARERPAVEVVTNVRNALTKAQKYYLSSIAGAAWQIQQNAGLTTLTKDEWRHIEVAKVTGRPGLRECQNGHFRVLKAHFLTLSGDIAAAVNPQPTGQTGAYPGELIEDRETALNLIQAQLRESGFHENYALKIARTTFHLLPGCGLASLNAAQLTALLFTLRSRARRRKK